MNNNVYTTKVLGRDLMLNDIVVYNNELLIVDVRDNATTRILCKFNSFTIKREHNVVNANYYDRVTVSQPPDTIPYKSEPTCAATNSDIESFIDARAY